MDLKIIIHVLLSVLLVSSLQPGWEDYDLDKEWHEEICNKTVNPHLLSCWRFGTKSLESAPYPGGPESDPSGPPLQGNQNDCMYKSERPASECDFILILTNQSFGLLMPAETNRFTARMVEFTITHESLRLGDGVKSIPGNQWALIANQAESAEGADTKDPDFPHDLENKSCYENIRVNVSRPGVNYWSSPEHIVSTLHYPKPPPSLRPQNLSVFNNFWKFRGHYYSKHVWNFNPSGVLRFPNQTVRLRDKEIIITAMVYRHGWDWIPSQSLEIRFWHKFSTKPFLMFPAEHQSRTFAPQSTSLTWVWIVLCVVAVVVIILLIVVWLMVRKWKKGKTDRAASPPTGKKRSLQRKTSLQPERWPRSLMSLSKSGTSFESEASESSSPEKLPASPLKEAKGQLKPLKRPAGVKSLEKTSPKKTPA